MAITQVWFPKYIRNNTTIVDNWTTKMFTNHMILLKMGKQTNLIGGGL